MMAARPFVLPAHTLELHAVRRATRYGCGVHPSTRRARYKLCRGFSPPTRRESDVSLFQACCPAPPGPVRLLRPRPDRPDRAGHRRHVKPLRPLRLGNRGLVLALLNQWGAAGATSGSDCANLVSLTGTTLAWKTVWTWTGGNGVKSFTNINVNSGLNMQLSAISSIPTTWTWSQSTSSVVADVAYDLFTSNSAGGSAVNEIMIWLANFNAGPISAQFNSAGQAVPIVSNLSLGGHTWNLYFGSNGANNVYLSSPPAARSPASAPTSTSSLSFSPPTKASAPRSSSPPPKAAPKPPQARPRSHLGVQPRD
ncbi:concanavalin A-like lectin/glucanase domain-containing protein [Mycena rosella]|uniref:Concanavalin A-like lectin/glucanase domain-containing protein n=1 Tax=Mycena rosella TaxID=1033263 RepID=A0AAD7GCP1_MYCRO|nr:concanavalin A-like lectin/glucanase domain-containing protein [Mycena rosella]